MMKDEKTLVLDVRGLEPPEPLERVLDALGALANDHALLMLIDREPRPLYGILDNNGYRYQASLSHSGHYEILIRHRS